MRTVGTLHGTEREPLELSVEIEVKPSKVEQFLELFAPLERHTQTEPGCAGYRLYRALHDSARFALLERWASPRALLDHFDQSYFQDFSKSIEELELLRLPPRPILAGRLVDVDRLVAEVERLEGCDDAR